MKIERAFVAAALALFLFGLARSAELNNVILFVPDGLRSQIADYEHAPATARLRDEGVNFRNSHSVFPTFTSANASAFSTGHLSDGRLQQYHFPRLCGPSGERRRNAIPGVSMDNFLGAGKSNFTVFLKGTDQKGGPQDIDALVVYLRTTTLAPGKPLDPSDPAFGIPRIRKLD